MSVVDAEVLFASDDPRLRFLPEGPYELGDGRVSWVAIQHGDNDRIGSLNVLDVSRRMNVNYPLKGRPGFAFPTDQPDLFVIGLERRVVLFDLRQGETSVLCEELDAEVDETIVNDACLWEGNLIFGLKDLRFATAKAGLYLWRAADRQTIRLRDDQICSNGKFVTRRGDELTLYDIDSPTRQIVAYPLDIEAGRLGPRQVVIDLTDDPAVPDGMIATPDEQSVIVAMFNPNDADFGEARQYRLATGELQQVWRCPRSPRVTCPQLVDLSGRVHLLLTTAVEGMTDDQLARHTNAGALFIAPTDFATAPPAPRFATN
ncbi:MAG: SMP-30/gluconolactonase/LRE family protein [Planctomycetales bacterium]|nr:SMP-30/gluconolactonase/LRE family protein [Planctomycetales bacterium]